MNVDSSVSILLVEDNPLDARATLRAAERLKLANSIHHVDNGTAALEYLEQCSHDERPDLILLDLDLPELTVTAFLHRSETMSDTSSYRSSF